jgi:CRISPR-associated protein Cas1
MTAEIDPDDLLPVRMLNEYAYCPRLFHLMHVEGRWADNAFTVDGRNVHRRVDQLDHVLPDPEAAGLFPRAAVAGDASHEPEPAEGDEGDGSADDTSSPKGTDAGDEPPAVTRSVVLGSDGLGMTGKLDLVSTADDQAVPVETKRGRVPNNEQRSYEPERVQLMAQGLLLREHGYQCDHGVLYFAGSRTRVDVPFTADLEGRTLDLIALARHAATCTTLPAPLDDSPKCVGCSLAGICLPDETLALTALAALANMAPPEAVACPWGSRASDDTATDDPPSPAAATDTEAPPVPAGPIDVRRLFPARDDALPLYVQEQGATVGKSGQSLVIRKGKDKLASVGLKDVSQLVLCGNISVSAQTLHLLCEAGIPVVHLSTGHWFYGLTTGITLRNAYARAAQYQAAADPARCLALAKTIVAAKGANQRTFLRRNASPSPDGDLEDMAELLRKVPSAQSVEQLLGLEGNLAARYFANFNRMLSPRDFDACWDFHNRNRRPPKDPVNAMLSFGYAMLAKECTIAVLAEGLDPWWGLYHQPRHGRPALALDLMEEFRPLVVDSAVITAVNTGMVAARDFTRSAAGCLLAPGGRKAFIRAYEARLDQLVTHPIFDYRCSWRSIIRLQARLLARFLQGDVPQYTGMVTR